MNLADQELCECDGELLDNLNYWLFRYDFNEIATKYLTNSLTDLDISGPANDISLLILTSDNLQVV